jgi:N-formylglutamate amidohydrolase
MSPRVVVHIPHASTVIPADVAPPIALSPADVETELLAMTDHDTDALFALDPAVATSVCFPVSRLVVDPERFTEDADEPMASRGMGVVYTRTSDGRLLRDDPSPTERAALLARFYAPHHERLTAAVTDALAAHGACLIVDGHSFPSRPLPYELDQELDRPDVCVGTDPRHTPAWLRDLAVLELEREDFRVAVDRPFAGALVPLAFYGRDARVHAFMVEVNRALYMDERSGARRGDFEIVQTRILGALYRVIEKWGGGVVSEVSPSLGE